MKIVCISDTHNKHKQIDCGEGDILIHAGDATGRGQSGEIEPFLKWFGSQKFNFKILIAGNHDWGFEREPERYEEMCAKYGIYYLNDSGMEVQCPLTKETIKIWGSPVQPEFCNWAFNRRVSENLDVDIYHYSGKIYPWIKPHWDKIPNDTDILITHGPPLGVRDGVQNAFHGKDKVTHVGCPHLMKAIKRVKPKLHVFGHIHEEHGVTHEYGTMFVNAAQLNDRYNVTYKPVEIQWEEELKNK